MYITSKGLFAVVPNEIRYAFSGSVALTETSEILLVVLV